MNRLHPSAQRQLALDVLRGLRERGYVAYWAGGCVRDQLLGRTPKDYDVATDAAPQVIREIFGRRRTLFIGAAFGVVTVVGPKAAGQIEVTTFRSDATYSDGRHPDAVTFTTPEIDAQRRDFTINGLFYDPLSNQVIDYVGGQEDLQQGIVRAIGDPRARFEEDKLRMIRAIRFTSRFAFSLDPATYEAIRAMPEKLRVVSVERIAQELKAIVTGPNRRQAMELLHDTGLLAVFLPELAALAGESPRARWLETLAALDRLSDPGFALAMAALLHAIDDDPAKAARQVQAICRRLRMSVKDEERAAWLVAQQASLKKAAGRPWSQIQPLLAAPGGSELLALYEAISDEEGTRDLGFCRGWLARPTTELNPAPLVTGDDLRAVGIPPGKAYKTLLEQLRAAQLDGEISTPAAALELAQRLYTQLGS